MIESDFDSLTDTEILVLLIIDGSRPVMKTRLQKISLLYQEIFDNDKKNRTNHSAYLFGGYSDDIDESAVNLADTGILQETSAGYNLTEYGKALRKYILDEYDDEEEIVHVENINKSLKNMPDKNIVGLTYHFFEDTAANSTIKESVTRFNNSARYDGIALKEYDKNAFILKIRNGEVIQRG